MEMSSASSSPLTLITNGITTMPHMAKTVRVHDDTHRALKQIRDRKRSRSIDEVIREMIRQTTGVNVKEGFRHRDTELTTYLKA